jgi:hypothetical protein
VELENPGNVWGVVTPPQDWLRCSETNTSLTQLVGAVAAPQEPATTMVNLGETPVKTEPKMAEVTTFPSPSPAASAPPAPKAAEAPKPQRVVVTPEGLISALQGKLQFAAEKAVQAAVAKHVNDAVRQALSSIDDVRQSSVRELQELLPKRVEAMKLSLKEESSGEMAAQWREQIEVYRGRAEELAQRLEKQAAELRRELANAQEFVEKMTEETAPRLHARLNEAAAHATSEFDGMAARVVDRRYERLLENTQIVTREALSKLDARSAEVQALVQSAGNATLGELQRQTELHVNMALAETKERAVAALSSLDAESRAACDARRQALEAEVARSAERSTEQFRKGMKAFLYSCLVAAVNAVDEHAKSTLEGLLKDNGKTLRETGIESRTHDENEIIRDAENDPLTH